MLQLLSRRSTNQPRLVPGTAVIVEGLRSQPEWNGARGLVQSFDESKGRYKLLVKERERTLQLGVKIECCRLEWMVEQERQELEVPGAAVVSEPEPEPSPVLSPP